MVETREIGPFASISATDGHKNCPNGLDLESIGNHKEEISKRSSCFSPQSVQESVYSVILHACPGPPIIRSSGHGVLAVSALWSVCRQYLRAIASDFTPVREITRCC